MFLKYVLAAADTEVLDIASSTIGTLKDNVLGVFSGQIANIMIVVATVFVIVWLVRLFKRMVGGR
jgi:hypothetical protein